MKFSSFEYIALLGITVVLYYNIPRNFRWLMLLISSIAFLAYISISFVGFTFLFIILNYFIARGIESLHGQKARRLLYLAGILADVGILAFYKYINFFIENLNLLSGAFFDTSVPYFDVILPVGISFYTFQAIGYLVKVYRGAQPAEKHMGVFAAYMMFFPKFLSGPIERAEHFIPQIRRGGEFDANEASEGVRLILWGMFKKLVVADSFSVIINSTYHNLNEYHGISLIITMFLQTVQIYCDFSGYTDIALGSARMLGIRLTDNFERPFFSPNVSVFWRRWHISLSSWCNDFIFKPVILKRRKWGIWASTYAVFLTFLVIGIWHGPRWTFVILGVLQGLAINYEFFTKRTRLSVASRLNPQLVMFLSRAITFTFFSFSLIFFNAHSLQDAGYFISHMFTRISLNFSEFNLGLNRVDLVISSVAFLIILLVEYMQEKGIAVKMRFLALPRWVKWSFFYVLIFLLFYFNKNQESFVYVQF